MNPLSRSLKEIDYGLFLPALARMPIPLARSLSNLRGDLSYRLKFHSRRAALNNVSSVFPDASNGRVRGVVKEAFRTLSLDETESYWFGRPLSRLQPLVEFLDPSPLQTALERGKGVVLYTGHIGTTGLVLTILGKMGFPLNLAFRPSEMAPGLPRSWYRYAKKRIALLEEASARPVLYTGRNSYFSMRRKLRGGEILVMGLDVLPAYLKRTLSVEFLGRPALFPEGLARLCLDSGASVVFWSNSPGPPCRVTFEDQTPKVCKLDDPRALTQFLVKTLEDAVIKAPGYWLMWEALHQLWAAKR